MAGKHTISIIVPVYNTRPWLRECVASVKAQTDPDWELLLVDDGSTDGSGALCDELAGTDRRIRVFHRENGGVGRARNTGLEEAAGGFLLFLDSDDTLVPHALSWLRSHQSGTDIDYVFFAFEEETEEGSSCRALPLPKRYLTADEYVYYVLTGAYNQPLTCCNSFFKREYLQDLRFEADRPYGEDTLFICSLLRDGGMVYYEPEPLYHYRVSREGNTQGQKSLDKCRQTVQVWQRVRVELQGWESAPLQIVEKLLVDSSLEACRQACAEQDREAAREFRGLAFYYWRRICGYSRIRLKDKIRLLIYLLFPRLGYALWMKLRGRA